MRRSRKNRLLADAERFDGLFPQHDPDANLGYASEKVVRSNSGHSSGRSDESHGGMRRPLSDGTMRSTDQNSIRSGRGGANANGYAPPPPGLAGAGAGVGTRPAYANPNANAYNTYERPFAGNAYNQAAYNQSQVSLTRAPTQNTVASGWGNGGMQYGHPQPAVAQVNARSDFAAPQAQQGPGARAGGLNFTGV